MANKYLSVSELRKLLGIPTDGQCTGCQFSTFHGCKDDSLRMVCEAIDDAPEANVADVVRCKDCRFYYKDEDGYEMCDASEGYDHISADGFCAWAERRTDNGN